MITENLSTLKIHKLTKEQYDREYANGNLDENALYLTPETDLKQLQQLLFSQIDVNGNSTAEGILSYPDKPGVYRVTTEIDGCPARWGALVIFNSGDMSSGYIFHIFTNGEDLWYARTENTYAVSKWKLASTTYRLSKSGSTIILTGSDGSVSSVEDETDSGSETSSGMKREFNTGLINTSSYTTASNAAKIYVVTFKVGTSVIGNPLCHSCTFDYMACASLGNVMDMPLDNVHTATMRINADKTVTFGVSRSDDQPHTISIAHICGYY